MTVDSVVALSPLSALITVQQQLDELEMSSPSRFPKSSTIREKTPVLNEYHSYLVNRKVRLLVMLESNTNYENVKMVVAPRLV